MILIPESVLPSPPARSTSLICEGHGAFGGCSLLDSGISLADVFLFHYLLLLARILELGEMYTHRELYLKVTSLL